MRAVSVWDHQPTADEVLSKRVEAGWRPVPSLLKDGAQVLGHACSLKP